MWQCDTVTFTLFAEISGYLWIHNWGSNHKPSPHDLWDITITSTPLENSFHLLRWRRMEMSRSQHNFDVVWFNLEYQLNTSASNLSSWNPPDPHWCKGSKLTETNLGTIGSVKWLSSALLISSNHRTVDLLKRQKQGLFYGSPTHVFAWKSSWACCTRPPQDKLHQAPHPDPVAICSNHV